MAQDRMEGCCFDLSYLAPTPPLILLLKGLKTAADSEAGGHHSTDPRRDLEQQTPAEDEGLLPQHHLSFLQDRRWLGDEVEMAGT